MMVGEKGRVSIGGLGGVNGVKLEDGFNLG